MQCLRCGNEIQLTDRFCAQCGALAQQQNQWANPAQQVYPVQSQPLYYYPPVSSKRVSSAPFLAWSICCILLCWPLAIPAIVFAAKIDTQNRWGNYQMAEFYAKRSKLFCILASSIGGFIWIMQIANIVSLSYRW